MGKNNKKELKDILKNKRSIIVVAAVLLLIIIAIVIVVIRKEKNIKVVELNYINPLSAPNEVEAAKLVKQNIVKITNKIDDETSIIGTGFFIKEGYLITNSHIVDIMGNITIEYSDGTSANAYLYSNSIEHDIALLKVENVKVKALPFGNSSAKEVTNDVLAAGYIYNFAGEATISKGILSARRESNSLTYLQSDISIDTGSSGGPLFDATAAVLGINTYVTENRTFALSLSSESLAMIIDVLLDDPNIEYLTDHRPSNLINAILVEVGYTDNENLDLYGDKEKINRSRKKYRTKIAEANDNETTDSQEKVRERYTCSEGYNLVGKKCVRQTSYNATNDYGNCNNDYTQSGQICTKKTVVDATAHYDCKGTLTENKTCIEKVLEERGFATYNSRWGSCPQGKNCYDEGTDHHTNTMNNVFVSDMVCPAGSTKIYSGSKIIWTNEEYKESNFKFWQSRVPGAQMQKDSNGLTYYIDVDNVLALCAKEYNNEAGVYTVYTYDELKGTACPNGGTLTAHTNNQGFYCKVTNSAHWYSWDVTCDDTAFTVMTTRGGVVTCGRWTDWEHAVNPDYSCEKGMMRSDGKTCEITDTYTLPDNYICNAGDTLNGSICLKTEIIDAIKR